MLGPWRLAWTKPDVRGRGEDAVPIAVFDFGMADCTSALFDLAVAIERSKVSWLAPDMSQWQVRYDALGAFLRGYETQTTAFHNVTPGAGRCAAPLPRPLRPQ